MAQERYESVKDFLEAKIQGRPHTFEEICLRVEKSTVACMRELNGLLLRHEVNVVVLRFNKRECPFYTMRKDVEITLVKEA